MVGAVALFLIREPHGERLLGVTGSGSRSDGGQRRYRLQVFDLRIIYIHVY